MAQALNGAGEPPAAAGPKQSLAARWLLLVLLSAGVMIAFVDRTSISSALASQHFVKHFNLSNVDRGAVNSVFFWSYGVIQLPMGWLVDRYGVKWPYTICFLLWSIATIATGLTTTLGALVLVRFIIGATEAVVIPASYRWIRDNFEERQSGTAVGLFTMGNKFGPAIGAPVAAWLIVHYDWQMMFFATGAVGIVWLIPWVLTMRNDWPAPADLAAIKHKASSVTLGSVLASPVVWGAMISSFCYGYFTFYAMTWMPAYLVERRGLSLERSGVFTFFSFAGIAVVALAAGWIADKLIERGSNAVFVRKAFVVAGFLGACTVLLGAYAHSIQAALFWNIFSLSFLGLTTANNLALCRLTLIPKPAVGLATGVQQVATSLAGGVAAALSGWLLHVSGGYDLPILVISVFLVMGAASTIIFMRPQWAPKVPGAPVADMPLAELDAIA